MRAALVLVVKRTPPVAVPPATGTMPQKTLVLPDVPALLPPAAGENAAAREMPQPSEHARRARNAAG